MNRWLAGHVFWPLTERLRRRDTMRRLAELNRTQHLPPEAMRALQEHKLRRLLRVAADHCPFHAERIRQAGVDPADPGLGLDTLKALPLLTRDDVRENLDEMTWFGCPRGGPRPYNTGGSSGEPLKFHFDRFRQAADWAARWRARQWWGVRPGDPELLLWGAPVELAANDRLRQWRDALLNQHILNAFDMTDAMMDAYIARIRAEHPACLYGYASSLALLSCHALANGLPAGALGSPRLRAVFVTGEVLVEPDRQAISSAFGAPVVIEYGSRDGGVLALGCPAGRLHIPQENVFIELLDDQGRHALPGQVGEVVVTHLETFAMPLIRYCTGDLARAWPGQGAPSLARQGVGDLKPCDCGASLAALAEVRGRLTDQIVCRAGNEIRRMHALALIYVLREVDGIRQFRVTQRSLDELDVDIVPTARFSADSERIILAGLRRRLGQGVDIRLHRLDRIPPSPSGKHACVVSQVC
jgi:phenylacetate-CoA ligase